MCWKLLWSEAGRDFRSVPALDAKVRNTLNIAKEIGGKEFSDTIMGDVEEHVEEHRGTLTNKELEDMLKSSQVMMVVVVMQKM